MKVRNRPCSTCGSTETAKYTGSNGRIFFACARGCGVLPADTLDALDRAGVQVKEAAVWSIDNEPPPWPKEPAEVIPFRPRRKP